LTLQLVVCAQVMHVNEDSIMLDDSGCPAFEIAFGSIRRPHCGDAAAATLPIVSYHGVYVMEPEEVAKVMI
jgi:hypothetical protein